MTPAGSWCSPQEEARALRHPAIGTEHLLLGILRDGDSVASRALDELGVTLERARQAVEDVAPPGDEAPRGQILFTPGAKNVLELSLREALKLGHNYIGPEHLLLGLVPGQRRRRSARAARARRIGRAGASAGRCAADRAPVPGHGPARLRPQHDPHSTAPASPRPRATAGSIRSSAGSARSNGCCRCCPAGPRTTPSSSASPASARPRSSTASPASSSAVRYRATCGTSSSTPSTSACW